MSNHPELAPTWFPGWQNEQPRSEMVKDFTIFKQGGESSVLVANDTIGQMGTVEDKLWATQYATYASVQAVHLLFSRVSDALRAAEAEDHTVTTNDILDCFEFERQAIIEGYDSIQHELCDLAESIGMETKKEFAK